MLVTTAPGCPGVDKRWRENVLTRPPKRKGVTGTRASGEGAAFLRFLCLYPLFAPLPSHKRLGFGPKAELGRAWDVCYCLDSSGRGRRICLLLRWGTQSCWVDRSPPSPPPSAPFSTLSTEDRMRACQWSSSSTDRMTSTSAICIQGKALAPRV